MSFIKEVQKARSVSFKNSLKDEFIIKQEEIKQEKSEFKELISFKISMLDELKSEILKAAKAGADQYTIIDNFVWIKPPYFKSQIDFEGVSINTADLLIKSRESLGFNIEWQDTYLQFKKESIQSELFLDLYEKLESLGLEPCFTQDLGRIKFGIKF